MKQRNSLKEILLKHLKNSPGWHKKGHLYVFAEDCGYSPESAGRALRELAEEQEINVDYYPGAIRKTKLARYCFDKPVEKIRYFEVRDGVAYEVWK